ncbi:hypothetical protein KIW84_041610 [Lathyrus oleraceus]|uniref:Uncharacterized protein n=1 Tax=Pisum sativum TaxID=3888 RepID=A0A9D4XA63_PEA|nr:hypothetical protein KIW84_041610 [Pisum sativum]
MAPKRDVTTKKQKTTGAGTSRGQESLDQTKFLKPEQHDRHQELIGRSIWYERIFEINPEGSYRSLNALWSSLKWDKLLNPHRKISTEVLRESYVDAFPSVGFAFFFSTKVGGRTIHFHRDVINEFLGNPLVLWEGRCAESGKEFRTGTRSTYLLVFPGLIMELLIASRVRIPSVVPFEIKTKVNDTYMDRFCLENKNKRRQAEQTWRTSSNTLNYGDWDLILL